MNDLWAPKIYSKAGFVKENILGGAAALDFGCGDRKLPGATGMDILKLPAVDVVHDVNKTPWPFADNSFDLVFGNHVLEHVADVLGTLGEIHRIVKPGGTVVVQVPYFRCTDAFNDPTHQHFFATHTLDYCIEGTTLANYRYTNFLFRKAGFWYGWPHPSKNPIKHRLKSYIESHSKFYDQHLSILLPAECLTWELEVIK
jgi:SAM-dependent methyltransferase